jgi:hypothetical protein
LTIKLTPHTTSREVLLLALHITSDLFRSGRTCCYPSDIQLSKITNYYEDSLSQPSAAVTRSCTDE